MDSSVQETRQSIREEVRRLCQDFPDTYWQDVDKHEKYPKEFVDALTTSGYLAALIPEEYGGAGLGITEASIILEEINRSGGNGDRSRRANAPPRPVPKRARSVEKRSDPYKKRVSATLTSRVAPAAGRHWTRIGA